MVLICQQKIPTESVALSSESVTVTVQGKRQKARQTQTNKTVGLVQGGGGVVVTVENVIKGFAQTCLGERP